MRAFLYPCFLGLCFAHARATLLPGVSVDEKQAKNVLGRRVKRDLNEECIEEVLENKSVLEECVFEGCNNEEVAEYPWQIRMHVEKIQEMYRLGQITVNGVAYTLDSVINSVKNVHNTI